MAKKSTTDTCCLTLPLKLEKWQSDRLEKRFEIARQIYNTLVNFELKKLKRLEESPEYKEITAQIQEALNSESRSESNLKALYKALNDLRRKAGFDEYSFKTDIKDFYKHFKDNIRSNVAAHGIAPQVWAAFEKLFYGNGRKIHFKRKGEMNSLRGYSVTGKSGGKEIIFRGTYIEWNGLKLPIKADPDNPYETDMLRNRVKYCRIVRKPGKRRPRWYVQLMLEGKPTLKCRKDTNEPRHPVGSGIVGIDIGPQTIAYVAESEASLQELAAQTNGIERERRILQRKLDRSRRATNPDNYAEDGTIKRGVKLTRNKSKRYLRTQRELAFLQSKQAESRKRQHNALANHLISLGNVFVVEDMDWPALTHRAKQTEISEKTGRYKRKKRFGKSVGNKAPAMLIGMLDQKLNSRGTGGVIKVPTSLRASQYNHLTGEYHKKTLGQRWNDMPDGRRLQRDLYSAFLLQHANLDSMEYDSEALNRDYESFVQHHDSVIEKLRTSGRTLASMGMVRTPSAQ